MTLNKPKINNMIAACLQFSLAFRNMLGFILGSKFWIDVWLPAT